MSQASFCIGLRDDKDPPILGGKTLKFCFLPPPDSRNVSFRVKHKAGRVQVIRDQEVNGAKSWRDFWRLAWTAGAIRCTANTMLRTIVITIAATATFPRHLRLAATARASPTTRRTASMEGANPKSNGGMSGALRRRMRSAINGRKRRITASEQAIPPMSQSHALAHLPSRCRSPRTASHVAPASRASAGKAGKIYEGSFVRENEKKSTTTPHQIHKKSNSSCRSVSSARSRRRRVHR